MISENRYQWVDYAKGIGIILVVYGHCIRGIAKAGLIEGDSVFMLLDSMVYSFHMPLFFFLSGLFFEGSLQRNGGGKFVFSKVGTLIYPYFLWSFLQGGIEIALSSLTNGNKTIDTLLNIWFAPIAQFWFLYCLFFAFVTVLLLRHFSVGKHIVVAISVLMYFVVGWLGVPSVVEYFFHHLAFFVLGVFFSKCVFELKESLKLFLTVTCVFFAAQLLVHTTGYNYTGKGLYSAFLAVLGIYWVVLLSKILAGRKIYVIELLGQASMSIYLMHLIAASGARIISQKFFGIETLIIHISLGLFLGLAMPYLAHYLIARFKIPFVLSAPLSSVLIRWKRLQNQ